MHHFGGVLNGQVQAAAVVLGQLLLQDRPIADQDHVSLSSRAASTAPSTVAWGAKSPPIASSAILTAHPAGYSSISASWRPR